MISSFNDFYDNLSSSGLFFFWVVIFLFVFLLGFAILLFIKNKKLIDLLEREVNTSNNSMVIENNVVNDSEVINEVSSKEDENVIIDEVKTYEENRESNLYQKNVLRGRMQTSPIDIKREDGSVNSYTYDNGLGMVEDSSVSPLIDMPDYYEDNDNMKFASDIVSRMEDEIKPSNIELTDFERKQEEEAIISYDELLKVKDKIYNITDDEENDDFIDELKSFRLDLR